jgi:hypothetical protein
MNKMMAATIKPRRGHPRAVRDSVAAETGIDHPGPDSDEDEEEGPQDLGEQPPTFVAVVQEVELPGDRVRLPK